MKPMALTKDEVSEAREMHAASRPVSEIAEYLGCQTQQVLAVVQPTIARPRPRTSGGLRDILFDEIASLQRGDTEPQRASAVANLAKQIISVAKAEIDFRQILPNEKGDQASLGSLQLGSPSNATDAEEPATDH